MKNIILFFLCVTMAAMSVDAKVIYVKSGATGNGTSWDNAFGTLNEAAVAAVTNDEIWVGPGLFIVTKTSGNNGLLLEPTVSIYGGFAGTETAISQREKVANGKPWQFINVTEIKGADASTRIFQMKNMGSSAATPYSDRPRFEPGIFDGLKMTHVNDGGTRIMWSRESSVIWKNCQFIGMKDGTSCLYFEDAKGGVEDSYFEGCKNAIIIQTAVTTIGYGATTTIKNCEFSKSERPVFIFNVSGDSGLAIPSAEISNCKFYDNKSGGFGTDPSAACIAMPQGDATRAVVVSGCSFKNNAFNGYGAATIAKWKNGNIVVYNNIFENNSNSYFPGVGEAGHGAILWYYVPAEGASIGSVLFNNVFVKNSAEYVVNAAGYIFNNTIVDNTGINFIQNGIKGSYAWNNIFANNLVGGVDSAVRLEPSRNTDNTYTEETNSVYAFNANTVSISEIPVGELVDNVLITDPGFADATAGNYSLAASSPCLGIGSNMLFIDEMVPAGLIELMQGMVDMGGNAYDIAAETIHAGAFQGAATGIKSAEKAVNFEAYATVGGVVVKVQNAAQLNVYSFNGQLVETRQISEGETTVSLANGLYLVKVTDKSASATIKVAVK